MELPEYWTLFYNQLNYYLPKGVNFDYETQTPYFSGYFMPTLYDWDQYFDGIIQLYAGWPSTYIKNAVGIFISKQDKDGHIGRSVPDTWHYDMVKPFLAQMVLLCLHKDGHLDWLTEDFYSKLSRYLEHWLFAHDKRGEGLSTWMSAGHSGMDNHFERAGRYKDDFCEGVDLNSYLVRESLEMSLIAKYMKKDSDSRHFEELSKKRADSILKNCWDDSDKFFYDINSRTGKFIKVKYAGSFAVMWANIVSDEKAELIVKRHLLNENEFNRPWPVPALSADQSGYVTGYLKDELTGAANWRANTWIPVNYYIFAGLGNYGFVKEAVWLAEKSYALFRRHPFCEYYLTEPGIGTGQKPFWGWSNLALFMPLEHHLKINPTKIDVQNDSFDRMQRYITSIEFQTLRSPAYEN